MAVICLNGLSCLKSSSSSGISAWRVIRTLILDGGGSRGGDGGGGGICMLARGSFASSIV